MYLNYINIFLIESVLLYCYNYHGFIFSLSAARKKESESSKTVTYKGVWCYQKNKKIDVAITVLKTKHRETHLPVSIKLNLYFMLLIFY